MDEEKGVKDLSKGESRNPGKKGKWFFLTLITLSGIVVFSMLFLALEGDKVTVYTIDKFVLENGALAREFSDEISPEERREALIELRRFFASAKEGFESKEKISLIGSNLREIMSDGRVTRDELERLRRLLET